jgi:hypothetical protein
MEDEVKLKVNPPTVQKLVIGPELKFHCNAVKVTGAFIATEAKLPSRLCTVGIPLPSALCHPPATTAVAVAAEEVLRLTDPAKVM